VIDQLSTLPQLAPDPHRDDGVRRRCHVALRRPPVNRRSRLDAALFTECAAYLLTAAVQLLTFF
jgi:hypothetical protein